MTQPTIKESLMCCITDGFKNQVDSLEVEKFRHFARLICEEMTGTKKFTAFCECGEDYNCLEGLEDESDKPYNERIDEENKKAQEILKALE